MAGAIGKHRIRVKAVGSLNRDARANYRLALHVEYGPRESTDRDFRVNVDNSCERPRNARTTAEFERVVSWHTPGEADLNFSVGRVARECLSALVFRKRLLAQGTGENQVLRTIVDKRSRRGA